MGWMAGLRGMVCAIQIIGQNIPVEDDKTESFQRNDDLAALGISDGDIIEVLRC